MARLCERPGCSERGAVAYGFDAERLLVWLATFDPDIDRPRAGVLCTRHADSLVVPVGWTLDDRREPTPPLFRAPPTTRRKRQPRRSPSTSTRGAAAKASVDELPLQSEGRTVAELTGADADDPEATAAEPWMPVFDANDDLDGLLRAETPLLARAFQGPARRR
jgi:hypothetical protein